MYTEIKQIYTYHFQEKYSLFLPTMKRPLEEMSINDPYNQTSKQLLITIPNMKREALTQLQITNCRPGLLHSHLSRLI